MTPTMLRFALGLSALATFVGASARADIPNFSLVGIEGEGSLSGHLNDRLGPDVGRTDHVINIEDCNDYAGGTAVFTVKIDPLPTGDYQYAVAYAPPEKSCPTDSANPTPTAGTCYLATSAQQDLTKTTFDFKVAFDDLIGSDCDAKKEGTATIYIITELVTGGSVNVEKISVDIDLKAPTAPTISKTSGGDQRISVSWTDEVNDSAETEYNVYWSDATFGDADLDAVSKKAGLSALSYSIDSGLENDIVYYVGVSAVDKADNISSLSALSEATPIQTTDFWEGYRGAGGADPGGCGAAGDGLDASWILGALGLLAWTAGRGRGRRLLLAILCVALVPMVAAGARADSPRTMMLSLHGGSYIPNVDSEFSAATPWHDAFGSGGMTLLRMDLDYELWQDFGTIAIGAGLGYGWIDGHARTATGEASTDSVGFNLVPINLSFIYRWDWAAVHAGVPLVPYGKIGVSAGIWWATDGKNNISNAVAADGSAHEGRGINFGWHVAGGLMFLLDIFSPGTARGFDEEAGVNHSYLFAEYSYTSLDNFGASDAMVLSDATFSFGLAFEF